MLHFQRRTNAEKGDKSNRKEKRIEHNYIMACGVAFLYLIVVAPNTHTRLSSGFCLIRAVSFSCTSFRFDHRHRHHRRSPDCYELSYSFGCAGGFCIFFCNLRHAWPQTNNGNVIFSSLLFPTVWNIWNFTPCFHSSAFDVVAFSDNSYS